MTIRLLAVVAVVLLGNEVTLAVQSGDEIALRMTDRLAKEYAMAEGAIKPIDGSSVEVVGTVAQRLPNGQLRIEYYSARPQPAAATRLITLTATIPASIVKSEVTRKGTMVYASPESKNGKATTERTEMLHVTLSDLKGVKLRTWTLASEVGQ